MTAPVKEPEFRQLGIQTAERPIGENHNPCGAGVFDFRKMAIGGLTPFCETSGRSQTPRHDAPAARL
jgi:hypothetical protein